MNEQRLHGKVLKKNQKTYYGLIRPKGTLPLNFMNKDVHFHYSCVEGDSSIEVEDEVLFTLEPTSLLNPTALVVWKEGCGKCRDKMESAQSSGVNPLCLNFSHHTENQRKDRKEEIITEDSKTLQNLKHTATNRKEFKLFGRVVKVIHNKRFGFIKPQEILPEYTQKDVHFNFSVIQPSCNVKEGDHVFFTLDPASSTKPTALTVWKDEQPQTCRKIGREKMSRSNSISSSCPENSLEGNEKPGTCNEGSVTYNYQQFQFQMKGSVKILKSENIGFLKVLGESGKRVNNDVYFVPAKVLSTFIPLEVGDIVEFSLNDKNVEKPSAFQVRLTHCKMRSVEVIEHYLKRIYTFLLSGPEEEQNDIPTDIINILYALPVWKCIGNCKNMSFDMIKMLIRTLCALKSQTPSYSGLFKSVLQTLGETEFLNLWKGNLKWFIDNLSSETTWENLLDLQQFLVMLVQNVPEKSQAVVNSLKPLLQKSEHPVQKLLYALLKEMIKSSNGNVDDMEWNELPLIPPTSELFSGPLETYSNLRRVNTERPYSSSEDYMDIYFRLLRADCFDALKKGITNFLSGTLDVRDMKVYYDVYLVGLQVTSQGLAVALKLKPLQPVKNWNICSNLMFGNLLCISPSGSFKDCIWATVTDRELLITHQIIVAELCSDCNSVSDSEAVLILQNCSKCTIMAESPTYYKAYQPVLKALQKMNPETLPFCTELVETKISSPPSYIKHDMYTLQNIKIFIKNICLDKSQEEAVVQTMSNRVAIIQGPPGTGKSFVGIKLVQLILSCKAKPSGPILVLTYKNHILDEFLKDLIINGIDNIVRVGGRSDEKELHNVNLNEVRKSSRMTTVLFNERKKLQSKIKAMKSSIDESFNNLLKSRYFSVEVFLKHISTQQAKLFLSNVFRTPENQKKSKQNQNVLKGIDNILNFEDEQCKYALATTPELVSAVHRWCPAVSVFNKVKTKWCKHFGFQEYKANNVRQFGSDNVFDEKDIEDEMKERIASTYQKNPILKKELLKTLTLDYNKMDEKNERLCLFPETKYISSHISFANIIFVEDLWCLTVEERVKFIQAILLKEYEDASTGFQKLLQEYQQLCKEKTEIECQHNINVLKFKSVIGMTITGASIHNDLLVNLKPSVILVEEAAEVLEPQLIAVLGEWVQHLILIGDHKQLKPPVESYTLAKEFGLNLSMMERLINNNLLYVTLKIQNRMRPEIADLLLDIYPQLQSNLARVCNNKAPNCIKKSVFFWDHDNPENKGRSYSNDEEADRCVRLALFLVQQGYNPSQITVLGAYQGQVSLIRKKLQVAQFLDERQNNESELGKENSRIGVHTIDLYQGDENDIVIVSLVRSSEQSNIGFLKDINRRCVAQSRAKCGLYFIGNSTTFSTCFHWKTLIKKMRESGCVDTVFPLHCPDHKCSTIKAKCASDITLGSFCMSLCLQIMPCNNHRCLQLCQPKHQHDKCKKKVSVKLACGHTVKKECYISDTPHTCQQEVSFVFELCHHRGVRQCFEKIENVRCKEPCPKLLPCKHSCSLECGQECNPNYCEDCDRIKLEEEERRRKMEQRIREMEKKEVECQLRKLRQETLEYYRIELKPEGDTASEYFDVEDRVKLYIQPEHKWFPVVKKIEKCFNLKLKKAWLETKLKMQDPSRNELKFHGTSADAVESIVKDGFQIPRSKDHMYGPGIYFASNSSKSAQIIYTKGSNTLLLCEVLLGKSWTVNSAQKDMTLQKLKTRGYDSLYAQRGTKTSGGVLNDEYVIYNPHQALPKYIISYETVDPESLPLQGSLERAAMKKTKPDIVHHKIKPKRSVNFNDPLDIHFRIAESQFLRLLSKCRDLQNKLIISSVDYYINPSLVCAFNKEKENILKKRGSAEEILAFHGTPSDNIKGIVINNFKLEKLGANTRSAGKYGAGIYLSEFPSTSLNYGPSLLLCKVLPGLSYKCSNTMVGASLKSGYDSHIDETDENGRGTEIVIFNPNQILPCYVINLELKK
ncbi:NFX1-type zinc finger-containing protein 1-like [Tachypleus tridentatus]|uniref:NFX1-type zinc finger-containing protein 1-like n=1 Tax=Tachypleus tridentatus TaxID=6853 RepID=UPI003FD25F01